MKLFLTIFLFAGFLPTAFISKAQDDIYNSPPPVKHKKNISENDDNNYPRKIKTGFVFIDGKYIEPLYIFKRKKMALYLNNIKLWEYKVQTENPFWYPVRLGNPPCINKNSSFKEMINCKDPTGKTSWINAVGNYFLTHYDYLAANDSLIEYYRSLPNVKSLTKKPHEFWKLVLYDGEVIPKMFEPYWVKKNSMRWGPNGTGGPKEKDYVRIIDNQIKNIKTNLVQNEMIFITTKQKTFFPMVINYNEVPQKNLLEYFWKIMNTGYSTEQKIDSLIDFGFSRALQSPYCDTIRLSPAFKQRIDKINSKPKDRKKDKLTGSVQLKKMDLNDNQQSGQNRDFSGICFSPAGKEIQYYCPFVYDNSVFGQYQNEYSQVYDLLENQDYSQPVLYRDYNENDDFWADCSYQSLINMRDAGVAYIATHGTLDGLILWASTSSTSIDTWCSNDPLIIKIPIDPQNYPYFWDINQPLYYAAAHADWATHYWKNTQDQNNALTILSDCYSDLNGWTQGCGGVAFGYDDSTTYDNQGIKYNNRELLKRMNGEYSNGNKRNAQDAYGDMPIHKDLFEISVNNNNITLCPATKDYYPANGDVVSNPGTGYFDIDTWCKAVSINPTDQQNSPIWFETQGNIQVNNVHWDNPEGTPPNLRAHKIVYDWSGDGTVTVHINTQNIVSWSSNPSDPGHRLDFNRVTPNSETTGTSYTFSTQSNFVNVDFYADHTLVAKDNPIQFTDNSITSGSITQYVWYFGDGNLSGGANPVHTYSSPGTYSVTLEIHVGTSYGSYTTTKTNYITVFDPTTNTGDLECNASANGYNGFIFASYSGFNSPDYTYDYTFDFGDGTGENDEINASIISANHVYDDGIFDPQVQLQITDWNDQPIYTGTAHCDELDIGYYNPCDNFHVTNITYTDDEGNFPAYTNAQPVTLLPEIDGGTPPYVYYWDFSPDPSSGYINNGNPYSTITNPQLMFSHEGNYPVHLQVIDAEGCSSSFSIDIEVVEPWDCYHNFTVRSGDNYDFAVVQGIGFDDNGNFGLCRNMFRYHYWIPWNYSCTYGNTQCVDPPVIWHKNNSQIPPSQTYNYTPGDGYADIGFFDAGIYDVWAEIDAASMCGNGEDHLPVIVANCQGSADSQDIIDYFHNPNPPPDLLVLNNISPEPMVSGQFHLDATLSNDLDFYYGSYDFIACDKIVMENGFETGDGKYIFESNRIEPCDLSYQYVTMNNQNALFVKKQGEIPFSGNLFSVSPNPFTKEVIISFTINNDSPVEIAVFNAIGQKIATLVNNDYGAGKYNITTDLGYLKPGVYYCGLRSFYFNKTIKIVKL